jgi:hypothetical protein
LMRLSAVLEAWVQLIFRRGTGRPKRNSDMNSAKGRHRIDKAS